jgi:hypothetical protein
MRLPLQSIGPSGLCLVHHLDEHFSGLRRVDHFPHKRDLGSLHAIPDFQAQVQTETIDRSHLHLMCMNASKPIYEQDERIFVVGIHLDEAVTSWHWRRTEAANTKR